MMRPRILITASIYIADHEKFRKRSIRAIKAEEQEWEDLRKSKDYAYNVCKHIMILGEYIQAARMS